MPACRPAPSWHMKRSSYLACPTPNKLLLLAGNYNEHLQEGGGAATERAERFPYVLEAADHHAYRPRQARGHSKVSPDHIDWELELCIVMGRRARHVSEAEALNMWQASPSPTIFGSTISTQSRPQARGNDKWFDWEHGKWHDTFCPRGPCVACADAIADPQKLKMKLTVNGSVKQDATTGQQIFPVAAVVAFISDIVTLEPGDLISTGTPGGVGNRRAHIERGRPD